MRRLHWLLLLLVLLPAAVIAGPVVYYGSLTVPATGTVTFNQLHPSSCLGLNGSNILTDSAACLASIAAGNDIVITGASSAPTIAVTNAPSFTGTITDSAATAFSLTSTSGTTITDSVTGTNVGLLLSEPNATVVSGANLFQINNASGAAFHVSPQGAVVIDGTTPSAIYIVLNTQSASGYCTKAVDLNVDNSDVADTIHGNMFALLCNTVTNLAMNTGGDLGIGGAFYGSGAGLSSGTVPIAALTADTISGVALGGTLFALSFGTHLQGTDTSYTGAAAKTISTDATNANTASTIVARDSSGNFTAGTVTVGSLIDSALTLSNCVGSDASKQLVSNTNCVLSVSGSGNMSVSAGPTPNVTITAAPSFSGTITDSAATPLAFSTTGTATVTTAATSGAALILNNTGASSGNLFKIQSNGTDEWFVSAVGAVTQSGNLSLTGTTPTISGNQNGTFGISNTTSGGSIRLTANVDNGFGIIANNNSATNGYPLRLMSNNVQVASVDFNGCYNVGSSSFCSTAATVNGTLTATTLNGTGLSASNAIACTDSSKNVTTAGCGGTVTSGTWTCTTSSATNCNTTKTVSSGSNCLVSMTTNPVITAGTFVFVSYASVSTTTLTITARNVFSGTGSNTASGVYHCNP